MRDESSERVTVTMPASTAATLRALVEAGGAPSISSYVADAVRDRMQRQAALERLHRHTGGPVPDEARAWAERALGVADGPAAATPRAS